MKEGDRSILIGVASAFLLLVFYLGVLALVSGRDYARSQFFDDIPFLILLVPGFGAQAALFTFIRSLAGAHGRMGAAAGTSGGLSGASMVACCAHYIPTLLPFVGVSAAATLIMAWRTPLLVIAVLSNLVGLAYMLRVLRKVQGMKHRTPAPA